LPPLLRRLPRYRFSVLARDGVVFFKNSTLQNPLLGILVYVVGVGLENDALARAEQARVHHVVEPARELLLVIVRVAVRVQVNVGLRRPTGLIFLRR